MIRDLLCSRATYLCVDIIVDDVIIINFKLYGMMAGWAFIVMGH